MIVSEWFAQRMEDKLIELMGAKEYDKWSTETAKEGFRYAVEELPEGEFKDFCHKHFNEIVNGGLGGKQ